MIPTPTKLWIGFSLLIISAGAGFIYGHHVATVAAELDAKTIELSRAQDHNKAWVERFILANQLATRDLQLAVAQREAMEARTKTTIKTEVVYREKIKNPDTRRVIADSGLLQLYDSTLGVSKTRQ